MNKNLFFVSLSLICAPACLLAARAETPDAAPVWSSRADGFASVVTPDANGTTGGAGGRVVAATNLAELEKYALAPEPLVILIEGTLVKEPFGKSIQIASNKTLLGLGDDATILHGELGLSGVSNVIIRNLILRDSAVSGDYEGKTNDFDGVQIDNSHHIWIDHCLITRMGDGLIDYRKDSDYLTVSWCVLSEHNKAFGVGWTNKNDGLRLTLHHTWIHDTNQRNPSLDNGTGHLYNNWLQSIASYGNYARGRAKVVVENSVFEDANHALQRAPEAQLVARGNLFSGKSLDNQKSESKGKAFDPQKFYAYKLDDAASVPELLREYAGPQSNLGTPAMAELMASLTAQ